MSIQDPNSERRNLMLTALLFATYFYAGGSFPEDTVKLQVINADFSRPEVLGYIAWFCFGWFLYRYWQIHSGTFSSEFKKEFTDWRNLNYIQGYINSCIGNDNLACKDDKEGYLLLRLLVQNWHVVGDCKYITHIKKDSQGNLSGSFICSDAEYNGYIKFTGIAGWTAGLRALVECAIKKPSFSNYIFPYILSIFAIAGALIYG